MRGTLRQNFMFKSKTCEMCIVDLNIAKALGNMYIHTFFFARPLNIKTQQCYIDIILLGIFRPFGANIYINKCYFAKSYSAKCKNSKYFGDRFMCEIILSHKYSFTDDLQSITYYIICTLMRIKNVLIYAPFFFMLLRKNITLRISSKFQTVWNIG